MTKAEIDTLLITDRKFVYGGTCMCGGSMAHKYYKEKYMIKWWPSSRRFELYENMGRGSMMTRFGGSTERLIPTLTQHNL